MKPIDPLTLAPKALFLAHKADASTHSDYMASPLFHAAAQAALLECQRTWCGGEVQSLTVAGIKLRGAQEFLATLMNIGVPTVPAAPMSSGGLTPPEDILKNVR